MVEDIWKKIYHPRPGDVIEFWYLHEDGSIQRTEFHQYLNKPGKMIPLLIRNGIRYEIKGILLK